MLTSMLRAQVVLTSTFSEVSVVIKYSPFSQSILIWQIATLRVPLGKLGDDDSAFIGELLGRTPARSEIAAAIDGRFRSRRDATRATP